MKGNNVDMRLLLRSSPQINHGAVQSVTLHHFEHQWLRTSTVILTIFETIEVTYEKDALDLIKEAHVKNANSLVTSIYSCRKLTAPVLWKKCMFCYHQYETYSITSSMLWCFNPTNCSFIGTTCTCMKWCGDRCMWTDWTYCNAYLYYNNTRSGFLINGMIGKISIIQGMNTVSFFQNRNPTRIEWTQ
jgi:hypothetical protein